MDYEDCNQSEEERAVTGSLVMDEVTKTIGKGYKLLENLEVSKLNNFTRLLR